MSKESTVIFRAISTPQIIFKSPKKCMFTFKWEKRLHSETELKCIIDFLNQKQDKTYISKLISLGQQSIVTVSDLNENQVVSPNLDFELR